MATFEVTRSNGTTITVDADSAEQAAWRGKDGGFSVTEVVEVSDDAPSIAESSDFVPASDDSPTLNTRGSDPEPNTEETDDADNPG